MFQTASGKVSVSFSQFSTFLSFWQGFCQSLPVFPVSGRVSGSKRLTLQLFPLKSQSKTSFHLSSQSGGPAPCTGQAAWGIVKIWGWKLSLRHLLASSQPPYTLETSRLNPDSLTHVSKSILETHQGRNYTQFTHIYPYLYSIYPYLPIFINQNV